MGEPTAPIPFGGDGAVRPRLVAAVEVPSAVINELVATSAAVTTDADACAEASRDWWPLGLQWALNGEVGGLAAAVVRPADVDEVAAVVRVCHDHAVPITVAGGRSGVCGASVPVHGGVVLDTGGLQGVAAVDDASLIVDVGAGTYGHDLEHTLRTDHGVTVGHWPQSVALSTVGGWLACRGAGQYSTRYGKIEDMVVGLDVVLADGRAISTGGAPRAAAGPDLTQLFVGAEGTLGVITGARLRAHPVPPAERRAAYGFASFAAGLDACRRILRRGATPAVLRLYDAAESARSYSTRDIHLLLVLDEGDAAIVDAVMTVVADECSEAEFLGTEFVEQWLNHRNDVTALEAFTRKGFVVDTMEIAARWRDLPAIYDAATAALRTVPHAVAATAHLSHSYTDGACLYFTFAALPPADEREATYVTLWNAGAAAVLEHGGNLSHHHGVGLNRARFMADALGPGLEVLQAVKAALDPRGILNPGKLGLPSAFGAVRWPA